MRFASSVSVLVGILLATACKGDDGGGWEDFAGDTGDVGDTTGTSEDDETTTDTESDESTTGDPADLERTRYIVTASDSALLLGIDLDDPLDPPPAAELIVGEGSTGLFGATPFNSEIVAHDGRIDQLSVDELGEWDFSPLLQYDAMWDAMWMDHVFFGNDGANAVAAIGPMPFGATNTLLWLQYNDVGHINGTSVITPPIMENGSVLVLGRSPDSKWAAVLVDVENDSLWQLYVLSIDPTPTMAIYIDQMDFTGLPASSVSDFVWLHLENERLVYRKEGEPGVFRPLVVDLTLPVVDRVELVPDLGHINSLVWSRDNTRVLVSSGGGGGYRDLYLVELDGTTSFSAPLRITELGSPAQVNTQAGIDFRTIGHGFDDYNRIWYAYTNQMQGETANVNIALVVVVDGDIISRDDLTPVAPGMEIADVTWDAEHQRIGYRAQMPGSSSIYHVDMTEPFAASVRINLDFAHDNALPDDHAKFAWGADGRSIVIAGEQADMPVLWVADPTDIDGDTNLEITLPDVEAGGVTLDHTPHVSPDSEQVILWYSVQDGRTGLVHAPLDGSGEGQVVLGLEHPLRQGAWLRRVPE